MFLPFRASWLVDGCRLEWLGGRGLRLFWFLQFRVWCFVSLRLVSDRFALDAPFVPFRFVSFCRFVSVSFRFRFGFVSGSFRAAWFGSVPVCFWCSFFFFLLFSDVTFDFISDVLVRFVDAVLCRFNAQHRWRGPFLAEMELLKRAIGWFGFDSLAPSDATVVRKREPHNMFFFSSSVYHLLKNPGTDVS